MVVDYGMWVKGSEWAPTSAPIWMDGNWMSNFFHLIFVFVLPTFICIVHFFWGGGGSSTLPCPFDLAKKTYNNFFSLILTTST
jgi:hypothetical protein